MQSSASLMLVGAVLMALGGWTTRGCVDAATIRGDPAAWRQAAESGEISKLNLAVRHHFHNAGADFLTGDETEEPATVEPKTVAPATEEPKTVAPATEEPKTVAPATEEPKTVAPATEEPKTVAPATEEPKTVAPATEEPKTVAPATEEPKTVAPATEEPKTLAPATEEPKTLAPATEEPKTLAPATEEPKTLAPATEEPKTLAPATEEPKTLASRGGTSPFDLGPIGDTPGALHQALRVSRPEREHGWLHRSVQSLDVRGTFPLSNVTNEP
ncbi:uncharacterized protein LOC142929319 [Petromyzon marinus]|uniref:uncharacterized protein LOC142929319 n=1 Tax=Petromyzon marinus TaxID=7757 RepID=UPI003F70A35E